VASRCSAVHLASSAVAAADAADQRKPARRPTKAERAAILLFASIYPVQDKKPIENHTPEFTLRIRLIAPPAPGEFDEFDLERFHVGQSYVVPSRLASLLIIAGYAELIDSHQRRAEAAAFGHPRFPTRK
jgi:hypothetical protein